MKLANLFQSEHNCKAVLLGSGSSIKHITNDQWAKILADDVWALNNWVYHPWVVPDFYYIEVKKYNYEIVQRRLREKQRSYRNVNFIFPKDKTLRMLDGRRLALKDLVWPGANVYEYEYVYRDQKRTHSPFNAEYKMCPERLTKSYDMSITCVLEMMYRCGYKTIGLFGVDLNDSRYFWTNSPAYGEVHHQTNKEHEGKNPNEPHATYRIKDFIVDFDRRWMRPEGRRLYVSHTHTALYPGLELQEL